MFILHFRRDFYAKNVKAVGHDGEIDAYNLTAEGFLRAAVYRTGFIEARKVLGETVKVIRDFIRSEICEGSRESGFIFGERFHKCALGRMKGR